MAIVKRQRPFKVLNDRLAHQDGLMGERFTVTDLNVATMMDLAPQCGIGLDAWPHMQQWRGRCLVRPAASDWKEVRFSIPRPATPMGLLRMFI